MKKISSIIISLLLFAACASDKLREEDSWEGIQGGALQVLALYGFSEYAYEREDKNVITDNLVVDAKRRAVLVIINYIRTKYPLLYDSREVDSLLVECFEKPRIVFLDCTEMDCRALVSFDVSPALEILENRFGSRQTGE